MILGCVSVYEEQAECLFQRRTHLLCAKDPYILCDAKTSRQDLYPLSQNLKVKTKDLGSPQPSSLKAQ